MLTPLFQWMKTPNIVWISLAMNALSRNSCFALKLITVHLKRLRFRKLKKKKQKNATKLCSDYILSESRWGATFPAAWNKPWISSLRNKSPCRKWWWIFFLALTDRPKNFLAVSQRWKPHCSAQNSNLKVGQFSQWQYSSHVMLALVVLPYHPDPTKSCSFQDRIKCQGVLCFWAERDCKPGRPCGVMYVSSLSSPNPPPTPTLDPTLTWPDHVTGIYYVVTS